MRGREDHRVEPAQAIVFRPSSYSRSRCAGLSLSNRRDEAGRKSSVEKPKLTQELTPKFVRRSTAGRREPTRYSL